MSIYGYIEVDLDDHEEAVKQYAIDRLHMVRVDELDVSDLENIFLDNEGLFKEFDVFRYPSAKKRFQSNVEILAKRIEMYQTGLVDGEELMSVLRKCNAQLVIAYEDLKNEEGVK